MSLRQSEAFYRSSGIPNLVVSNEAPICKGRYPVHSVCEDREDYCRLTFVMPKCIRFARMSEKSYEWLCKLFAAVAERISENLEPILGKTFMGFASWNFSGFETEAEKIISDGLQCSR